MTKEEKQKALNILRQELETNKTRLDGAETTLQNCLDQFEALNRKLKELLEIETDG